MTDLEKPEEFYARVLAATDAERRLPVALEEMPGWDIFPFETEGLRIKPLAALANAETPRRGEDPAECWCSRPPSEKREGSYAWSNERWVLNTWLEGKLPVALNLDPRTHHDLADLPDELASEFGRLIVAIAAAVEELPSVGRVHLARYGDGSAHLHQFFFGRSARILQFRGSTLIDWEENLPTVPEGVLKANAGHVGRRLVEKFGGDGPAWERSS